MPPSDGSSVRRLVWGLSETLRAKELGFVLLDPGLKDPAFYPAYELAYWEVLQSVGWVAANPAATQR
jgi:hypothetical protein